MEDKITCPLVDKKISPVDCMENRAVKDEYIPAEYKQKEGWKDICRKCKYYNF